MKKLFGTFLLFLTLQCFHIALLAQIAPCPSANVEVFALDPQSGPHNYFGVKVTLNHTYPTNIVVTGYIYDADAGSNTNHPFTLTVTTGNLTDATSETFYETDATASATIDISSQTAMNCFVNPYNYVGQLHNDGLDYALANLGHAIDTGQDMVDIVEEYFHSLNSGYSVIEFFDSTKSLWNEFNEATDDCDVYTNYGASSNFCYYAALMQTILTNASTAEDFFISMGYLEAEIDDASLSSDEKAVLLGGAAVYRYSAFYWTTTAKVNAWEALFEEIPMAVQFDEGNNTSAEKVYPVEALFEETPMVVQIGRGNNTLKTWHPVNWKVVAGKDGEGFVQGFAAGVVAGILLPPIAPLAPVVAGLAWGIGNSLASVIGQWTHWW
ncbi:MAG TPA: hypothetical protein VLJ68_02030 [Chitinophagaceae bacterium]|nr:hypothetical protein [Chitinophagaceae bacterium]